MRSELGRLSRYFPDVEKVTIVATQGRASVLKKLIIRMMK
jgi:hypothetical protein